MHLPRLILLLAPAFGGAAVARPASLMAELAAAEREVDGLRQAAAEPGLSPSARQALLQRAAGPMQALAELQTFAGAPEAALATFDAVGKMLGGAPVQAAAADADAAAGVPHDAIGAIVAAARGRQVVILNEAHHVPQHRAFGMQLARALRDIGFTHLAIETLNERPFAAGYVNAASGYYLREPAFANFVRDAQRGKWVLVPYEAQDFDPALSFAEQVRQRETAQADNLIRRVLAADPAARIFLYVGYDHLREQPKPGDTWLAAILRQRTGIDPLTIDQATMFAHPPHSHPLYARLAEKSRSGRPFMLRGAGGWQVFGKYKGEADMQVIHPPYPLSAASGRPAWMASLSGYRPRPLPTGLWPATGRRLIEVRRKGAAPDETPLDTILAQAGARAPKIMAPPGPVSVTASDAP